MPITGFIIQRRSVIEDWTMIDVISGDMMSFFDADVNMSIFYDYRIIAMNAAGEGEPSNPVSAEITVPEEELPFYANWNFNIIGLVFVITLVTFGIIWYLRYRSRQIDKEFRKWQEDSD